MDVKEMKCRIDDTIKFFRELSEDAYISKGKFCDGCRGMFCGAYNVYVDELNDVWNYVSLKSDFYSVHLIDEPKPIVLRCAFGAALKGIRHTIAFFDNNENITEILEYGSGYKRETMEDYFRNRLEFLDKVKKYIVRGF